MSEYNGYKKAFYDFGTILTGNVSHKYIKITNDSQVKQDYEIQRDPATNPIDYVFEVEPYTLSVEPGASFIFKLQYAPSVPFTISFDYFNVSDIYGICLKFGAKGKSLGPGVFTSTKNLVLKCIGPAKEASKTIELKNESSVTAQYNFDIDEKQSIFMVNKSHGNIHPNKCVYVTITFVPKSPGVYSKHLYCLIHYQHPIIIDVVGLCSYRGILQNDNELIYLPQLQYITKGYQGYVSDRLNITGHNPPVALSVSHIDFGQTDVEGTQTIPGTVSVTNHIKMNVFIVWDKDVDDVFKLDPNSTLIPSGESVLFQVYFRPSKPDKLYARELDANAYWGEHPKAPNQGEKIHVPIPLTLKLMGHTFPSNSCGWIPQYKVLPQRVILPACVPPLAVYTTFIVKRFGHLPLMFKFIQPQITNYVVKPMQGLITKDYQIIVVQMCSKNQGESAYIERWGLQFNGSSQNEILVEFRAYAEYPMVHIGRQNTVTFPPTFPLTEESTYIFMKNCTRHCIRYNFTTPEYANCLKLIETTGVIASNEIIYTLWNFLPRFIGDHYIHIKCEITALYYCYYSFGLPLDTWVMAYGLCDDTNLVALPNKINCGSLICGETEEKTFYLFNFGHCKINFKLKLIGDSFTNKEDVALFPIIGTVEPGCKNKIKVTIKPSESGIIDITIAYSIRLNSKSNEVIARPHVAVVSLHYFGILPTLQIYDLKYAGGGPIFCKVSLWKMMHINMINHVLNTLPPNSTSSVNIYLPHAPLHNNSLSVILLLRNQSEVDTAWSVKYHKMCACKLIIKNKGLSHRVLCYHCPHQSLLTIQPTNGHLHAYQEDEITITVKYDVLGTSNIAYVLRLSNNREIVLIAQIVVLPLDNQAPSAFTNAMILKSIFIGDQYPIAQLYWLYNNTHIPTEYQIDVSSLTDMRKFYCHISTLTCLNPSGTIPPKTSLPLIFKFKPIALQKYEVTVPLYLQPNWYDLKIIGDGVTNFDTDLYSMHYKVPEVRRFEHCKVLTEMSIDHIVMDPFPTHTKVERVIFLENCSNSMVTGYVWQIYKLPDILMCMVVPQKGTLQPGEKHICKLIMESQSMACLLTVQVTCELLNMTERRNYEKSVIIYEAVKKQLEDEFTITEKGITKPDTTMEILPCPMLYYRVLAVTCYITSCLDLDMKMTLQNQLKQTPAPELNIAQLKAPRLTFNELRLTKRILEKLIWDVLNSLWFKYNLKHLQEESNPYYCQFMMDENERAKLTNMSYVIPPSQLRESIINDIIYEVLHDEFNLGPVRKTNKSLDFSKMNTKKSETMENLWKKYCLENPIETRRDLKIKVPIGW